MTVNISLTTIILTHNEQANIAACLTSLAWCPQILIVDDYSRDQTLKIATKFPHVKITKHPLNGNFSAQRNFSLSQVTTV